MPGQEDPSGVDLGPGGQRRAHPGEVVDVVVQAGSPPVPGAVADAALVVAQRREAALGQGVRQRAGDVDAHATVVRVPVERAGAGRQEHRRHGRGDVGEGERAGEWGIAGHLYRQLAHLRTPR